MNHGFQSIKRIFVRNTGDNLNDELSKQPIPDADAKLTLFNNILGITTNAFESYIKSMSKSVDMTLKEKFDECSEQFIKYENKPNDPLELAKNILLNIVLSKTTEVQQHAANEVLELTRSIEKTIVKTLSDYQKEVNVVKDARKELKNAYKGVDDCKQNLEKSRRDVENCRKQMELVRITNDIRKVSEIQKQLISAEEKTTKCERELDEAQFVANERYDKYTEGLYKKVSEEHELANCYLEYLRLQQKYHYNVYKRLEETIPEVKSSIHNYPKKPIFGCSIDEHIRLISNDNITSSDQVSPVIRKLIEAMIRQNAYSEEGLFRIAGSKVKMNRLISAINAGYLDHIDLNDYDIHCLASVLKQYLRDLPDSIMCNSLYEDWLKSLNSPMKLDAFKQVLKKLPKTNYQNLKYIVRFLAGIVDNSEKTKMNVNNIGICFGVSLLNTNSDSNKNIDMSTATSAFDFILSNYLELFPENDMLPKVVPTSNSSNTNTPSAYQRSNATPVRTERNFNQINTPSNSNLTYRTASSDNDIGIVRHSIMVPDSKYVGNDGKYRTNEASSTQIRGHMKKNSFDFNVDDSKSLSPEVSNTVQSSPRRTKKIAPAPPINYENLSQVTNLYPKIDNSDKSQSSTVNKDNNNSSNSNSISSNSSNNNNNNNNNNEKILKLTDSSSNLASTIEKPTVAPPSVPVRPPPIGFKENVYNTSNSQTTDTNTVNNQILITSSTSSTSSSELNSPNNTLNKPPKPTYIPRKQTNINNIQTNNNDDTIETNEASNNGNSTSGNTNTVINNSNGSNKPNTDKPSSEITSL